MFFCVFVVRVVRWLLRAFVFVCCCLLLGGACLLFVVLLWVVDMCFLRVVLSYVVC